MTNHPLWKRLREYLWTRAPSSNTEHQLLVLLRGTAVLVRDVLDGQLTMRAMSLVYTTLLSLVPVLALGFSLFKALGIHNALEPVLQNLLAPLGPQGADITQSIVRFVENINVRAIGAVGVALLFFTVVSMLQKIESSFNYVWRIERVRGLGQRLSEYLTVIIVGPLLVFLALAITASVLNSSIVSAISAVEPFGALIFILGKLVPYLLIIAAFTFFYAFIPNTQVRLHAALAGGALAGFLWQSGSAAFAAFVASATNYNAIYSGFAIMLLLLIWLYLGWLILLIGCQLSYYVQHPERLTPTRIAPHLSGRLAELLGLQVFGIVARRFADAKPGPTLEELRRALPATPEHVDRVVEILLHRGLLVESSEDLRLLPKRDLDSLSMSELWGELRLGYDTPGEYRADDELSREVKQLLQQAEGAFAGSVGRQSVREWLSSAPASSGKASS